MSSPVLLNFEFESNKHEFAPTQTEEKHFINEYNDITNKQEEIFELKKRIYEVRFAGSDISNEEKPDTIKVRWFFILLTL
jgi:hypothetical protein